MCYFRNKLSEQGILVKKTIIQKAEYFNFAKGALK